MTDEFIDILNVDLSFQKTALKSEAHKYGWLHASVHIWFYTLDDKLLFQKRSLDKISFPDVWDVSVAGHIGAGESPELSALREIEEEIGLKIRIADLTSIGVYREKHVVNENYIDNEIHYIYKCFLRVPIRELKIQQEELTDLKLIPKTEFDTEIHQLIHQYAKHPLDYYQKVLSHI